MRVVPTRMLCKVMQAGPGSGIYKIFLYDEIKSKSFGWFSTMDAETSAKKIAAKLEEIPDGTTIELHINSNGGEAKEGVAIYNSLVNKKAKKIAYIDGVAYSAAFLPAILHTMSANDFPVFSDTSCMKATVLLYTAPNAPRMRPSSITAQ